VLARVGTLLGCLELKRGQNASRSLTLQIVDHFLLILSLLASHCVLSSESYSRGTLVGNVAVGIRSLIEGRRLGLKGLMLVAQLQK
jgi:hypothetical protein